MNEHEVRSLISQVETAVSGAIDRAPRARQTSPHQTRRPGHNRDRSAARWRRPPRGRGDRVRTGVCEPDRDRRGDLGTGGRAAGQPPPRDRHPGAGPAHGDRLLGAQHRQGDARRPPAHHDHRGRTGPAAGLPRCRGHPAKPPRRLGHPVRDAHPVRRRAPRRHMAPRPARRRHLDRVRIGRPVQGRPQTVRRRPGLRRPGAGTGGGVGSRSGRSTTGSAYCCNRRIPPGSRSTTIGCPTSSPN